MKALRIIRTFFRWSVSGVCVNSWTSELMFLRTSTNSAATAGETANFCAVTSDCLGLQTAQVQICFFSEKWRENNRAGKKETLFRNHLPLVLLALLQCSRCWARRCPSESRGQYLPLFGGLYSNHFHRHPACSSSCKGLELRLSKHNFQKKFDMMHIANATLAGGVGVGTAANAILFPLDAMIVGVTVGIVSTLGFKYLTVRHFILHTTENF